MSKGKISSLFQKKAVEDGLVRPAFRLIHRAVVWLLRKLFKLVLKIYGLIHKLFLLAGRIPDHFIRKAARYRQMRKIPVQNNKVLFLTFQGKYTCNAKYIAEELARRNKDIEMVWDLKSAHLDSEYPLSMRFVRHQTQDFYRELASARVIIENTNIVEQLDVPKKAEQILIQTWHGSLGIKKLDAPVVMDRHWENVCREVEKKCDYVLTNSPWEEDVFHQAYWKQNVEMLRLGHSRNDVFYYDRKKQKQIRNRVCQSLGIDPGYKLFLIAPTHREGINDKKMDLSEIQNVLKALHERFGGKWIILIRLHNRLVKKAKQWYRDTERIRNVTDYPDMQELMVAADAGMTDYSSWIFDYMESRKPGFIVEFDLADFENDRGFYYPIESTPFPIAPTMAELPERIREFDEEKYIRETDAFLKEKGCVDDGHSAERIVDRILELVEKG
ncbi:MAG: CDP-glycerol glycerophosphotransferase family protein [Erysipelotrichaceae bacterium]|nr:CDP-glycerol glycerophosphotransferase family protein [Erysipelotrichaceae bacterium]